MIQNQAKNRNYDIEMQTLQTLSQKLSNIMPDLQDYACNAYADKLAMIDLYLLTYKDNTQFRTQLLTLREQFKTVGRALYIKKADVLTNLGLAVGITGYHKPIPGKRNAATE